MYDNIITFNLRNTLTVAFMFGVVYAVVAVGARILRGGGSIFSNG